MKFHENISKIMACGLITNKTKRPEGQMENQSQIDLESDSQSIAEINCLINRRSISSPS